MNTAAGVPSLRLFARYLVHGAVLGACILGVGGRLAMGAFSLLTDLLLGFSVAGTVAVVASGTVYGVAGGVACWAVDHICLPSWVRAPPAERCCSW
jgi:hypothetical protein